MLSIPKKAWETTCNKKIKITKKNSQNFSTWFVKSESKGQPSRVNCFYTLADIERKKKVAEKERNANHQKFTHGQPSGKIIDPSLQEWNEIKASQRFTVGQTEQTLCDLAATRETGHVWEQQVGLRWKGGVSEAWRVESAQWFFHSVVAAYAVRAWLLPVGRVW